MQHAKWRTILQKTARDPQQLLTQLNMNAGQLQLSRHARDSFPLRVPDGFLGRIRPGDGNDPLLRQILPLAEEDVTTSGYSNDPVQENTVQPVPGLLHKYHGRALLIVTGACAIHCRYCFRRHFPYTDAVAAPRRWRRALAYLKQDAAITEIILSGGDPLTVANNKLGLLLDELAGIAHLKRLRIHTRVPIVLPERIDSDLISILTSTRLRPVMVVHANHPNELDASVACGIEKLRDVRILLMNQSVLLRNINDSVAVLQELSEKLFSIGIFPYYLHMLDAVQGAAHFAVPEDRAVKLIDQLRAALPGYLVPRLVREVPGHSSKIPVETMSV